MRPTERRVQPRMLALDKPPAWHPDPLVEIAAGLLEMRRAGLLTRLYIDAGVIRVGFGKTLTRIEYCDAVAMIDAWRVRARDAR